MGKKGVQPQISCLRCQRVIRGLGGLAVHQAKVHGMVGRGGSDQSTYQSAYRAANKDRLARKHRLWYTQNLTYARERRNSVRKILKWEVFAAYGGKCECCGEDNAAFLGIDHVNSDGAEHRRKLKEDDPMFNSSTREPTGTNFYYWLKRRGYPKEYRVLCHNCNLGRHICGGICPHQGGIE